MAEELDDYNENFFDDLNVYTQAKFARFARQIDHGLYWSDTKEGHSYWSNIHRFFEKAAVMDLDDENDKESLFDNYATMTDPNPDNENYSVKAGIVDIQHLKDFYYELLPAFTWANSPQGPKFWGEMHTRVGLKIEAYDEE